jgi:glycosyltransferase involved in cell wall biosynthesis
VRGLPGGERLARWWRARTVVAPTVSPPAPATSISLELRLPAGVGAATVAGLRAASPRIRIEVPGEEPTSGDAAGYVYAPDRPEGLLTPHHLRNALLCLAHRALDFVVVSHGLEAAPALRLVSPRNATLFSAAAWSVVERTGRLPERARGRVLRLLPAPGDAPATDATVASLGWGPLRTVGTELHASAAPLAPAAARRSAGALFPPLEAGRPTVLVLPAMLAVGGVERNLIAVMEALRSRYAFVVAPTEPVAAARGSLGPQVLAACDALFDLGELAAQADLLPLLERVAADLRPDVVWICNGSPWLLGHAAALRRLFADVPIVDQQVYDAQAGWIEHYADPGIQSFDRFVAVNQQVRRAFEERIAIPPERIDMIYPAVDAGRFRPVPLDDGARAERAQALGLPAGRPLFAQVARLTAQKRPLEFLELARRSREAGLPASFVLVGDGELASACDAAIARDELDHVRRIPFCDDMSRLQPLFDGIVFTSAYEGLPIAMLEALCSGVPVLSTDVGDVGLVLADTGAGRVVERPGDREQIWQSFRRFTEELSQLREQARRAAPAIAERFSAAAAGQAYAESFERAREPYADRRVEGAGGPEPSPSRRAGRPPLAPLSVVIPTYNRGELLIETLRRCRECAGPVDLEFVVIDDGSRDDTAARLEALAREMPNLSWRTVPNGGPGQARNLGASLAKHDVVLFLGDDIQPCDDRFFLTHAELHAQRPETGFAVLGKVVWPNRRDGVVNFVMSRIQGAGGEQFGYAALEPFSFLDWRFFYTANVSVKRALVEDWLSEGFSRAFSLAAYEDGEFAYRMSRRPEPLRLFYTPGSVGTHHHPFSVDAFMGRQQNAGLMARVFLDLHPNAEVRHMLGLGGVAHALETRAHPTGDRNVVDFLSVIEGVKSWVRVIEGHQQLGSQWWHDGLLGAVFKLCYLQGFVMGSKAAKANVAAAYYLILDEFVRSLARVVQVEMTGRVLGPPDLQGLFSLTGALPPPPPPVSRLRAWALRQPMLPRLYRTLRDRLRRL